MQPIIPFDRDSFLHAEISKLVERWGVDVIYETGTYRGFTTIAFSLMCEKTFTVEVNQDNFEGACALFESIHERGEIIADRGSSAEVLQHTIAEAEGKRALFYLDAHWETEWPLLAELDAISNSVGPKPVIVIHDFKVPDRPEFGFDSYQGSDLDLDYVTDGLTSIYGDDWNYYYNRFSIGAHRGVLFVEPTA